MTAEVGWPDLDIAADGAVGWPHPAPMDATGLDPAVPRETSASLLDGGRDELPPTDGHDVPRETSGREIDHSADDAAPARAGDDVPRGTPSEEAQADRPPAGPSGVRAAIAPVPDGPWARPPARRVLTVANQKGGVGKTTSTVNLAAALALHSLRVLVLDLDPQGNASTAFALDHRAGVPSTYDVLVAGRAVDEVAVLVPGFETLWCVPATIDLAGAEIELVSMVARESRLMRALNAATTEYDYVLIDCPPSLGLLTLNAMVAAGELLIPMQCEFYALEGLTQLMSNIELVVAHLNPTLHVSTILLTMFDARTRLADQVAADVRAHFGDLVLDAVIPRSVRVSEAPGFGQTVVTYDPSSRGARSYLHAAHEMTRHASADGGPLEVPDEGVS